MVKALLSFNYQLSREDKYSIYQVSSDGNLSVVRTQPTVIDVTYKLDSRS